MIPGVFRYMIGNNHKHNQSRKPCAFNTGFVQKLLSKVLTTLSPTNHNPARGQITISVTLAESLPAAGLLWWYARLRDQDGSGKASFTIHGAAIDLGKSPKSIYAYLKTCEELELFRSVSVRKGVVNLYYKSVFKTMKMRGLNSFGVTYLAGLEELRQLKFANAEACAMHSQQNSYLSMINERQKREKSKAVKVDSLEDVFKPFQNMGSGQTLIYRSKRYAFMTEDFTLFGATLEYNAKSLGRTSRTIQRRLSKSYRKQRGIAPVPKIQIAQRQSIRPNNWKEAAQYSYDAACLTTGEAQKELMKEGKAFSKTFNLSNGQVFEAKNNLYNSRVSLFSKRQWREQLKRTLSQG